MKQIRLKDTVLKIGNCFDGCPILYDCYMCNLDCDVEISMEKIPKDCPLEDAE